MPETMKGAPKSTERKVVLGNGQETVRAETKPYFENAADYFTDEKARREQLTEAITALEAKDVASMDSEAALAHGRDLQAAHEALSAHVAEYKAFGGEELDQLRKNMAQAPNDANIKRAVQRKETAVHESYLNKHNEFAQEFARLSESERGEFVKGVVEELPTEGDDKYFEKIALLQQDMIANAGTTRSQAEYIVKEAVALQERQSKRATNKAPEGLPTTKEVEDAAKELEENGTKAGIIRRSWDALNFRAGMGLYAVGDFMARRKKQGEQKRKRLEDETDEQYEARLKKQGRRAIIGGAAIGALYLGARFVTMRAGADTSGFDGYAEVINGESGQGEFGQGSLGTFTEGLPVDSVENNDLSALPTEKEVVAAGAPSARETAEAPDRFAESAERGGIDTFTGTMFDGYDPAEDAFNMPGKTGEANWGAPIPAELATDAHFNVAGLDELVGQSWATSPEQLATVAAELGVDGFDTSTIEGMAEQLKSNPEYAQDVYTNMLDILNDPNTRISEGEPLIPGTYGSYYETMVDGNGVISYDHVINEPGSTIKIEYTDKNGVARVIELKRECGGQVIHRHPVEESVPMGGGSYNPAPHTENTPPQGGGTPEVPATPPENVPPIVENPPVVDNPPTGGETPPPPVTLEPKDETLDINVNPLLPEQLQMGDQAGTITAGELDLEPVEPPATYIPEPAPETSTEIADGADSNTRTETVGEAQPVIPVPEAGASGETAGDVVTGRVDG